MGDLLNSAGGREIRLHSTIEIIEHATTLSVLVDSDTDSAIKIIEHVETFLAVFCFKSTQNCWNKGGLIQLYSEQILGKQV